MKKKDRITIFCFMVLIGIPYLIWPFLARNIDTENYENRTHTLKPVLVSGNFTDFPKQCEEYINDHLPFRNQLIRLDSFMKYYLFGSSSSQKVAVGKDGWLFYIDEKDKDPLGCYKGTNLLDKEQLERIAKNLILSRDNLKREGIDLLVFIVPNREHIYDEYMPWYYGEKGENYAALQIYQYIRSNTDIDIIYPYEELKQTAESLGNKMSLYHKTDTHWNELGAYVGVRRLLEQLDIAMLPYDDENITIKKEKDVPGDMAKFLNLSTVIDPGWTYFPCGYQKGALIEEEYDLPTYIRYRAENADGRKVFINRDSFGTAMAEIVGSQFESSVMVYRGIYTNDMVAEEKPDIYILEMVERYAPGVLLEFVYE